MLDMVNKFFAEMLEHALHRHGGRIAQGANGAAQNIAGHGIQQIQIRCLTFAALNAIDHAPQPARAFAAGRALAA